MKKAAFCIALLAVIALAVPAQAAVITAGVYILSDHPDGALTGSHGPYGLRMDSLAPAGDGPTFSVSTNGALVTLSWAGGTSDAVISGTLWRNDIMSLVPVTYTLSNYFDPGGAGVVEHRKRAS